MSKPSHTPGPWSYSFESVDPEWAVVSMKGGLVVANVNADHRQEANARLIAAAPDLLAALKALDESGHTQATWQAALRAIAKAEAPCAAHP